MEEGGKEEDEMNEMFAWDSCSFSLWGAGEGGGKIEDGATVVEEDNGEEERKKRKRSVELGKAVIDEEKGNNNNGNDNEEVKVPEVHTQTERDRRKRMRDMFTTLQCLVPHLTSKADKSTIVEESVKYIRTLEQKLQILQDKKREKLKESNNGIISINPFAPSSSSFIPPQHQPACQHQQQLQMVSSDIISRASLLADHYHYYSSSSTSITPTNSNPTTPRSNLTSPLGSPIMMINNNDMILSETPVKLRLSPSSITFQTYTSKKVVVSVCGREAQFSLCGASKPGFYTGICLVLDKFQLEVKSLQISSDELSNLTMVTILARATALLDRYPVEEIYRAAGSEMLTWVSS